MFLSFANGGSENQDNAAQMSVAVSIVLEQREVKRTIGIEHDAADIQRRVKMTDP